MREIIFRGKRLDNGEWVYGHIYTQVDLPDTIEEKWYWYIKPIGSESWVSYRVDPYTVGQYTGLKDKNGKRIFEGDILKWDSREWGCDHLDIVNWNYELFNIRRTDWKEWCEVIGDIHDNPELLKEEAKT